MFSQVEPLDKSVKCEISNPFFLVLFTFVLFFLFGFLCCFPTPDIMSDFRARKGPTQTKHHVHNPVNFFKYLSLFLG